MWTLGTLVGNVAGVGFNSCGVTSLLLWPVRSMCLASSHVWGSFCLVSPSLGSDLSTLPQEPAWEVWQPLLFLLWIPPQACAGRQMVEGNSEPPLYVMMRKDQPPGKWKSEPTHLLILVNRTLKQTQREEGRKTFPKLPVCLCRCFLHLPVENSSSIYCFTCIISTLYWPYSVHCIVHI